jgi:hypothetical protein
MARWRVLTLTVALALTPLIYGASTASASVAVAVPQSHAVVTEFTHTFTIKATADAPNAPAATETCHGVVDMEKSKAFPGYIQAIAYVEDCAPLAAVTCAQTADVQFDNPNSGWNADGDGKTVHGCGGASDASIKTNTCESTDEALGYRTHGIFVVVDSGGQTLDWSGNSGTLTVTRIC